MAQTYEQIQKRIESLQKEAEQVRKKEVAGVVARIREAIEVYGLTAADLGFTAKAPKAAPTKKPGRKPAAPKAAGKVAVKYRDADGNTWTGRGLQPRWLKAALAAGKKLEDFRV